MELVSSNVVYNYKTIKITQSRLNKGLLAIPVSLTELFPQDKTKIHIFFGESKKHVEKNYTPYSSSSRECRIGGMKDFFEKNNLKNGDELVIQALDKDIFRIMTEKQFQHSVRVIEQKMESENDETIINSKFKELSLITNSSLLEVSLNEFKRLSENKSETRKYSKPRINTPKESVPNHLRILLTKLYSGKCQLTGFGFITKKGTPYFEIHHIKSDIGNHIKNLLVVSPNIHAQFTFAKVQEIFDNEGWLRTVKFNEQEHSVFQIIDNIPRKFYKEIHT